MKDKRIRFKIKVDYSKIPNPFHQEQVMRGGKIHKNKKKIIPRKKKYKEE